MSRSLWLVALFLTSAGVASGCGAGGTTTTTTMAKQVENALAADAAQPPPAGGGKPDPPAEPAARKIIYSASLEVVVKDLEAARQVVERLVEEYKGYVAKSEVSGAAGERRAAGWTLKVPADRFRPFVASLAGLGYTARNTSDSQDVTEEFVDIQARLKNLKSEEETLNRLLKDRAVVLDDVLKIRDQIKNVRGEIERAEGRLKYLATMAAVSTVTLTLREEANYVPPPAPTFGSRIGDTFRDSITALTNFGKGLTLAAVALAPWLPLILVGLVLARWSVRRIARAAGDSPSPRRPARAPRVARPIVRSEELIVEPGPQSRPDREGETSADPAP